MSAADPAGGDAPGAVSRGRHSGATVAEVTARALRVPTSQQTAISTRPLPHRDYVLVEVRDSDGASGSGYTYVGTDGGALVARAVTELLRPHALGAPAGGITELWRQLYREHLLIGRRGFLLRALSAFEIALWDLLGARTGLPLRMLLGSSVDSVPAYGSGGYYRPGDPVENIRAEVRRYRERGFVDFKMKVGGLPLHEDVKRIAAAREELGPLGRLALDANNAFDSVAEAMRAIDAYRAYDPWWIEEPLSPDDVEGHAALAARCGIPVATGEIEATRWGFAPLIRANGAHVIQADAPVAGGVGEWMRIAHAAATFDIPVAPHWHANLHAQLAAAVDNALTVEYFALEEGIYNFEELVEPSTRLAVEGGRVLLGAAPGVGVTYDLDALERFEIDVS